MWQKKQYTRVCECACLGSERDVLLDSIHPTSQSVVYLEGCDGILSLFVLIKMQGMLVLVMSCIQHGDPALNPANNLHQGGFTSRLNQSDL